MVEGVGIPVSWASLPKHSNSSGLGELCIVEILCGHEPVDHGPVLVGAQHGAGEHHAVEGHVILGHELPVLHVVRVLPPLLPVLRVLGGDADVPDGGVKPDVEDLVLEPLHGHRGSPLQVPGDASWLQPPLHSALSDNPGIVGPFL